MSWHERSLVAGSVLLLALAGTGCSIKRVAINSLADTLSGSGDVFASDDDPELIRDAVPFSLKTIESLLAEVPDHPGLLLSACSGFTQYAYAFIQADAEVAEPDDYERSMVLRERARKMYERATRYCLRRLELRLPGVEGALKKTPGAALVAATREDVPALYWTGAAWGSAITLGLDKPELIADLPAPRALLSRALDLDEAYEQGAIHAAMISIAALPEDLGGSTTRARQHFDRAIELSNGQSAGPYVTMATAVALPAQDRAEFERLLNLALAIDVNLRPGWRLANVLAQRRARFLLSRIDDLILASEPPAQARAGAGRRAVVALVPRAEVWVQVPLAPAQKGNVP
jgi:predicted anti-sigma-YlaC factor YlaD